MRNVSLIACLVFSCGALASEHKLDSSTTITPQTCNSVARISNYSPSEQQFPAFLYEDSYCFLESITNPDNINKSYIAVTFDDFWEMYHRFYEVFNRISTIEEQVIFTNSFMSSASKITHVSLVKNRVPDGFSLRFHHVTSRGTLSASRMNIVGDHNAQLAVSDFEKYRNSKLTDFSQEVDYVIFGG